MPEPAAAAANDHRPNEYRVDVRREDGGWTVAILDPDGREVSTRACADEVVARTYGSTVRQHIYWLSEETFRAYYRLPDRDGS